MYSDSEDEVFFGPLTMREIKIGFGVIEQKNMSTRKINEQHKMDSSKNSIIEISSEENSFADLDDKENANPIPSMKNIFISNNFEKAIHEIEMEDTLKNKFNECSSSTVSTTSEDTKSISSSFLDKLVECISEGNENLFDNIHIPRKKNVQLSPCLSRIEEIQSFNTNNSNNSNTSNKGNETFNLIKDISNSKSEQEIEISTDKQETSKDEVSEDFISSIDNDEGNSEAPGRILPINNLVSKTNEIHNDKIISKTSDESENRVYSSSSMNCSEDVFEKLYVCISSINNDEMVSEKFENCISPINNHEIITEKQNCISPINNTNKCMSPIKNHVSEINTEVNLENLNNCNDKVISEKTENCILPNNYGKEITEQLEHCGNLENMDTNAVENVSYEDDFEDIDSNSSSKMEDANEIEISKILDEDDSLNEINNTFSECTLNSTNTNDNIIQATDEVQKEEHEDYIKENEINVYSGYSELKTYNRIEEVDKIENIFFENRPESKLEIERNVELQDKEIHSEGSEDLNDQHYNVETNDTLDKFLENKIQNNNIDLNDSLLNESNTSSLGCQEINSSIENEEVDQFPSLNRKTSTNTIPSVNRKFSTSPIGHVHPKPLPQNDIDNNLKQANSPIGDSKELINRKFPMSPNENIPPKPYHQNDIDKNLKQANSPIGDSKELINRKFPMSPNENIPPKPYHQNDIDNNWKQANSPIGESKEAQLVNRKYSTSPIQHVHKKYHPQNSMDNLKEVNPSNGELKEVQSITSSSIEHVIRKPHRQTDIIDNNWKQALALSNDTLIAEQSMLPTSVTLLEKTNIDYNLNSPENNKDIFKPSTIPTILEKSEHSIDLTCSENESMLSGAHESYSTAFEDSETECNNTLDMIDRLLKMEAASNATTVQSAEKSKQIEHVSPRKPKLNSANVNSNIHSFTSKIQAPKAIPRPLEKSKIHSPLKITPKTPVISTPSRLGLQKGIAISNVKPSQSKISPLVKNAPPPRKGLPVRTPSSAAKNLSTKVNVNSPRMISPVTKNSKEPVLKSSSSKIVPTKLNVKSPKLISPLVKNTKESVLKSTSSATKTTSVDSPITAEVNELTESFDQSKAEDSFVQLRSTLRRQISDLYIEPSSADKRTTPKPKVVSNVEVKKNVFKTPTVSRVLKSTEKSRMSKNIMSPVDFYINKAPQSPLVVKCDYSKRQPKCFDKEKGKTTENNEIESIGNPLPFCAYKSASNVKLVEDNSAEVPKSVRKYFKTVQYVIKHESRIKTEERKSPRLRPQTTINNDSLSALDNSLSIFNASASANDVSVRVKKSALRTPK